MAYIGQPFTPIAVDSSQLIDGSVIETKIASLAVSVNKLAANAVTSAKIAEGTIITGDMADNAVTTAKIAELAITTARLNDNAVTSAKIADGTIIAGDLSDNAVITAKIAESAVTEARINNGAVTTAKININGDLNFNAANIDRAGLGETNVSSATNVLLLNYANSTTFKSIFFENTTLTPNNVPAGGCVMMLRANNAGAYTVSYSGNVKFVSNTAPTLTSGGEDFLFFICESDTRYLVTSQVNVQTNK